MTYEAKALEVLIGQQGCCDVCEVIDRQSCGCFDRLCVALAQSAAAERERYEAIIREHFGHTSSGDTCARKMLYDIAALAATRMGEPKEMK